MTNNYDDQIKSKNEELNIIIDKMDNIKQEYIKETEKWLKQWYQEKVNILVKRKSEITLDLEKDQLKEMKSSVNELINKTPQIIYKYLEEDNLWWHTADEDQKSSNEWMAYSSKEFKSIDNELHKAAGELAYILEKYGYLNTKPESNFDSDYWRKRDSYGYDMLEKTPYYPTRLEKSEQMKKLTEKYYIELQNAEKKMRDIRSIEKEKDQKSASELWDSI